MIRSIFAVVLIALLSSPVDAGWLFHRKRYQPQPWQACSQPATVAYSASVAPVVQATAQTAYGDAYGFGAWLNAERDRRGLGAVGCDGGLCNDAAVNSSRGFGHSFMGSARRQNAGVGPAGTVWAMWTQSGAHASALFDPSIRAYGIANVGGVWTYAAR